MLLWEFADVRNVIYDIRCKTEDGSSFLVEMQFFLNFRLKGFKPLTVRTIQLKVKETGELVTMDDLFAIFSGMVPKLFFSSSGR